MPSHAICLVLSRIALILLLAPWVTIADATEREPRRLVAVSCSWRPGRPRRVTALDLEGEGLDGQIPPCISNLTHLARVHLPFNKLRGPVPPELGQLSRLRYINLSSNALSGAIPDELASCSSLQVIASKNNSFGGGIPAALFNSSLIQVIDLRKNNLSGTIPHLVPYSTSLDVLVLTENSLSGDAYGGGVEACRWRRKGVERVVLAGVGGDGGESGAGSKAGALTVDSDGGEEGGEGERGAPRQRAGGWWKAGQGKDKKDDGEMEAAHERDCLLPRAAAQPLPTLPHPHPPPSPSPTHRRRWARVLTKLRAGRLPPPPPLSAAVVAVDSPNPAPAQLPSSATRPAVPPTPHLAAPEPASSVGPTCRRRPSLYGRW
ncbi:putative LRR receptor-like serine/threonine-protein kinase [Panicum miliaceum]|uniref:LRR receptor-like serine/threonine-protein kinase n=1 Tax=Panicum miliaceum TaxID=4540 RepID=A0A3L6RA54_PANMI|nr:putative LRR receptor-like serine/threonine-protein kinase [Panicum miliaceum]